MSAAPLSVGQLGACRGQTYSTRCPWGKSAGNDGTAVRRTKRPMPQLVALETRCPSDNSAGNRVTAVFRQLGACRDKADAHPLSLRQFGGNACADRCPSDNSASSATNALHPLSVGQLGGKSRHRCPSDKAARAATQLFLPAGSCEGGGPCGLRPSGPGATTCSRAASSKPKKNAPPSQARRLLSPPPRRAHAAVGRTLSFNICIQHYVPTPSLFNNRGEPDRLTTVNQFTLCSGRFVIKSNNNP